MKYGKLEIEDFRKEVKKKNVFIGNIMKKMEEFLVLI